MQFMTWERQRAYDLDAGREEGRNEKAVEAAEKLIKMNILTVEQIAEAQGLTVEQVLELKEKVSVKA